MRVTQLNKLKSAAKNKTGTTLRITKKNIHDGKLPYKLFLTTRQKTKIINAFADKVLSDIKLSQSQLISSDEFLSKILGNMIYIIPIDLAVPLTQDVLPKLVTKEIFSVSNKF